MAGDGEGDAEADADGDALGDADAEGDGVGEGSGGAGRMQYERSVTVTSSASFASSAFARVSKHRIRSPVACVRQYALAAGEGPAEGDAVALGLGVADVLGVGSGFGPTWTPARNVSACARLEKHSISSPSPSTTHTSDGWSCTSRLSEHVSDVVLGLGAPVDQVFAFQAEEVGWSPAHRRVGAARDLHLDRVPRQRDVGFTHPERVHSVPDVLERLFHDVLRRPLGGGQDHGGATLEVEPERWAKAPAEESHRGGSHEDQDEDDGRPEGAIASHASSAPLITSRKRASSNSAA